MPAASASRAWRRASRASRPSATWCPTGSSARRCGSASHAAPELTLRVPAQLQRACDRCRRRAPRGERARERRRSCFQARLVVAADGAHSLVRARPASARRWRITRRWRWSPTSRPTSRTTDRAFERFTPSGPLAVLPLAGGGRRGHLGAAPPSAPQRLLALGDAAYLARAAERLRLARRPLHARGPSRHLSAEAHARRGRRGHAHRADRQRRAGAAPGRRPGLQPRAARCGDARRGAGAGAGGGRRCPSSCSASPRGARRTGAAWCASPIRW